MAVAMFGVVSTVGGAVLCVGGVSCPCLELPVNTVRVLVVSVTVEY